LKKKWKKMKKKGCRMEEKEIRTVLSKNIKLFRSHRQWSQADLAAEAGISITFLSDIERGNKWPHPETLSHLSRAFEVDVYQLFKPHDTSVDGVSEILAKFVKDITAGITASIGETYQAYLTIEE
jgi:transcriptional regulator with XRE-family HTH domain